MATTVNLTTTYAGEVAGGYLQAAFLANTSLQHITVKDNIPFKQVVRKMTTTRTTFQEPSCTFNPSGTINLGERILTLSDLAYQEELCKLTFLQDWEALAAQNANINSVEDALITMVLANIGQINETMLWQGAASATSYAGLGTLIDANADSDINFVDNPEAITVANIIAKIELLLAEVPTRVENATEKPIIYMNQKTFHLYRQANVATGNGWYTYNGAAVAPTFMGIYDIAICPGMKDNTMYCAQKSNFWFGTNKMADWNSLSTIDMQPVNGDKTVRFDAMFFAGTQYGFGSEIAAYGPGLS